jgi:hypothetical protein
VVFKVGKLKEKRKGRYKEKEKKPKYIRER